MNNSKPRFEIIKTVLSDFVLFAIVDNEMNKVVCHMVYDNGEQYCDELANKIVSVLNMDLPSINETLTNLGIDYSKESKFNQTKLL